jgi:hypothetical protein
VPAEDAGPRSLRHDVGVVEVRVHLHYFDDSLLLCDTHVVVLDRDMLRAFVSSRILDQRQCPLVIVGISIPLLMLIPAHGRREACPGRVSKWTRTNILPAAQKAAT